MLEYIPIYNKRGFDMHFQRLKLQSKAIFAYLLCTLLLFTFALVYVSSSAYAADSKSISVLIDGKSQQYEQPPLIDNGHTLVPLRAIFEALGAEIKWNSASKTATA